MHEQPTTTPDLTGLVASEIRAEMARRGINQVTLADKVGELPTWVGRRINPASTRRAPITLDELARIAAVLDLTAGELIARATRQQVTV